ncbi:MAG: hypothetical protein VW405_12510, partial [Rhodospirillaceae bacterium]
MIDVQPAEPGSEAAGRQALSALYHDFFTGLILTIASNDGADAAGDWAFSLFRRQHLEKFLSSFDKLGLTGLPDAVAAARYHYLSNQIGGVTVEYVAESDRKAWVRFPHPRWIYMGPAICGVPESVGQGYVRGWYGHNGVSLGNPRLGFVCTSQDTHAHEGFAGYFLEYDRDLAPDERAVFTTGETMPPFDPAAAPVLDAAVWTAERLGKARRNYAMEYVRNGLTELIQLAGPEHAAALGGRTARLVGRQAYPELCHILGLDPADAGLAAFGRFMQAMAQAHGDTLDWTVDAGGLTLDQDGWRLVRGMDDVSP